MTLGGTYGAGFIIIRIAGVDITSDVLFSDASFIQRVNGRPGIFHLRVKDADQTHDFVPGARITLDIAGTRQFDGYATVVTRSLAFSVDDTSTPSDVARIWTLEGSDVNLLFQKRYVYDQDDPAQKLPVYPPGTTDQSIIEALVADMLKLEGDDISLGIETVGSPNPDLKGSVADIGMTWAQAMYFIAGIPGGIYYIDPERVFRYIDDDTADAPYPISDSPFWGEPPSDRVFPAVTWQDMGLVTTVWQANHAYVFGDYINVSDTIWFWVNDSGTSGPSTPTFGSPEIIVDDGDGGWIGLDVWEADHIYDPETVIQPTVANGHTYISLGPDTGLSGSVEPTFPTDGTTVTEGGGTVHDDGQPFDSIGYSTIIWTSDGSKMVNDAQVWGAGRGSRHVVYSRTEDSASIAEHGRWQIPDQFRYDVYKQPTVNKIADSIVYGSPQNLRGAKDPPSQVTCRILEHGYRAGMKVEVRSETFGLTEVIPIREMKISFPTPHDVFYDLSIWHEIDAALNYAEFPPYPGLRFPPFPPFPPFPIIEFPGPPPFEYRRCILAVDGSMDTVGSFEVIDSDGGATYVDGAFYLPLPIQGFSNVLVQTAAPPLSAGASHYVLRALVQTDTNGQVRFSLETDSGPPSAGTLTTDGGFLKVIAEVQFGTAQANTTTIPAGSLVWFELSADINGGANAGIWPIGGTPAHQAHSLSGTSEAPQYIRMFGLNVIGLNSATGNWYVSSMEVEAGETCGKYVNVFPGQPYGPTQVGTGNGIQTEFYVPTTSFYPGSLSVYIDGVLTAPFAEVPTSGGFTLLPAPGVGAVITAIWTPGFDEDVTTQTYTGHMRQSFDPSGDATFQLAGPYIEDSPVVYVGGVLIPPTEYTQDPDAGTITFDTPPTETVNVFYDVKNALLAIPVNSGDGGGT